MGVNKKDKIRGNVSVRALLFSVGFAIYADLSGY